LAAIEAQKLATAKTAKKEAQKAAQKDARIAANIAEQKMLSHARNEAVYSPLLLNADNVPQTDKVTLRYVVTQVGKNPFNFEFSNTAKLSEVSLSGMATKTGYAIAGHLSKLAQSAIDAKANYGRYITAFNPKAVFKIEVYVNAKLCFYALNSKGLDAIRLVDAKGLVSTKLLVDKFLMIAHQVETVANFVTSMNFANDIEAMVSSEAETENV
jgi:hypothetical protein